MLFPYVTLRGKDLPIIPIMLEGKHDWIQYNWKKGHFHSVSDLFRGKKENR